MSSATTVRKKTIKIDKNAVTNLNVSHLENQSINKNDWLSSISRWLSYL